MKITISKRLLEKYPAARFVAVTAAGFHNAKKSAVLEEEKRRIEAPIRKANITELHNLQKHKKFHESFGKSYHIEFEIKSIHKGKNLPSTSILSDVLFMTEMKHLCIMSGQDVKDIGDLTFDLGDGTEKLLLINGEEKRIKKDDILLKEGSNVLISLLYGPGKSTRIMDQTDSCLYLFWFAEPISDPELDVILKDFKGLLKKISSADSKIEAFEVPAGQEGFVVTPWEVKGDIDYDKLIRQFGTRKIDELLLRQIKENAGDHYFLRRKIFYSHMYLDEILKDYKKGHRFYLYTGRAPSGPVHLGHLIPWIFAKWLQDRFDATLLFQIPDEEKFLFKENLSLEETKKWAYENIIDIIAVGFDPKKTKIFLGTEYAGHMYRYACQVAKKITFSTIKSTFGFDNDRNIGEIFYTSMQSVPALLPTIMEGKKTSVLIPCAIDQDVHFRLTRDVAESLGYPKPATILSRFLPGLEGMGEQGKMSSSVESTAIFTTDSAETVKKKILKYAFSGGRDTVEEHRRLGGVPEIDVSYQWLTFFEEDDKRLDKIYKDYKSGKLLSGELKMILVDKVNSFLSEHQKRREQARKDLEKFMLRD